MSVFHWYEMHVMAKDRAATAKFFHFEDDQDVTGYGDRFEINFGGNYGPSLNMRKMIERNPDLIFLVKESIECDTVMWFLVRFDAATNTTQQVRIEDSGSQVIELNKRLFDEYTAKYPRHFEGKNKFRAIHWDSYLTSFDECAKILSKASEYKETISPMTEDDFFDEEVVDDD
jgi:hypothetical protein